MLLLVCMSFPHLHKRTQDSVGYRNLIEKGFQHRDISIGNVLWLDKPRITRSVFETFGSNSAPAGYEISLEAQLEQSRIKDSCQGFVIDGDMAIELESYFLKDHEESRSVRVSLLLS
jgi:hypothetical protein